MPPAASDAAVSDAIPRWVTELFNQKQYDLLAALFSSPNREATETDLCEKLGYTNPVNKADSLRRRVSETGRNLLARAEEIGETWQIRERTRSGSKFYYLDRQK